MLSGKEPYVLSREHSAITLNYLIYTAFAPLFSLFFIANSKKLITFVHYYCSA